jgi:hypothetical protein
MYTHLSKNAIQGKRTGGSPIPETSPLLRNDFIGSVYYFLVLKFTSAKVGSEEVQS